MPDKTEVTGLHRVSEGVLINKDNDAFYAYKKQKAAAKKISDMEQGLNNLKKDFVEFKNDIEEIKNMLKRIMSTHS